MRYIVTKSGRDPIPKITLSLLLRFGIISSLAFLVGGCSMPNMPDFSMAMPKVEMPDFGLGTTANRPVPAARHNLSPDEVRNLRAAVRATFPQGWDVSFLSVKAGLLHDDTIAACGLVTARGDPNDSARSYLYQVGQDGGAIANGPNGPLTVRQIASERGEQISIFSRCSAMKLL